MASEVSAAEQTTDGHDEEKKVIDDAKALEGENVCCDKETGGIVKSDEPKVEQQASLETAITDTKKTVEDEKDEAHAAEEVKKKDKDVKLPTSGVLQDEKDDVPVVVDVKEAIEDVKVSDSKVSANSEDVAENVKEKDETGKISSFEVAEVENLKADKGEKTTETSESLSKAVENVVVEPEISSVQELKELGQETEVSEPVIEIAKATGESSDIAADPVLAVEEKALAAIEPTSDATPELEKKDETHAYNEVLEVSKDQKILSNDVEISCEVSKEESDVKDSGNASVPRVLDDDVVSEKIKESSDDNCAGGCKEETKNEVTELTLVKELTVDPSLSKSSIVVSEAEPIDHSVVTEAAENAVKPEIKVESPEEVALETKPVEEQKEVKTVQTEATGEQKGRKTLEAMLAEEQVGENNVETQSAEEEKEEKALKANSTLIAAGKTGDLSNPADETTKTCIEEEKSLEGADKAAEEQKDSGGSDSATKTTEIPPEKEKASEVAEEPKDESVTDNTYLAHTSGDIDSDGKRDVVDTSIKEPVDKQEKMEKTSTADVKKDETEDKKDEDETEDKKDEAEENDTQKLVESSKDDPSSKLDVEAQKSETPAKPKTLISKLKRSIVKVKNAMIGKSPSTKTISAESKDASEVR